MRTILVTGLGGAGRSTVAVAAALAQSRDGRRTLLLTTDPGTAPGGPLTGLPAGERATGDRPDEDGDAPTSLPWTTPLRAAEHLWVASVASAGYFRSTLLGLQEHAHSLLDTLGAVPLDHDELTELPGAQALALLAAVRRARRDRGDRESPAGWQTLVVDLPVASRAIGQFALAEQLGRYLTRLLPPERRAARALRPMLAQLAGVPMPTQQLYDAAGQLGDELAAAQRAVSAPGSAVLLVAEPGEAAEPALRLARAGLALHGHRVAAVVANRLLPTGSPDPWLAALADRQQIALKTLSGSADAWTDRVCELPHLGREPRDPADLAPLADRLQRWLEWDTELVGRCPEVVDRLAADGLLVWRLPLPGAERETLGLVRRADELIVTTGPFRRVFTLPAALRRCTVAGAGLRDGELRVRFAPDPALWPTGRGGDPTAFG